MVFGQLVDSLHVFWHHSSSMPCPASSTAMQPIGSPCGARADSEAEAVAAMAAAAAAVAAAAASVAASAAAVGAVAAAVGAVAVAATGGCAGVSSLSSSPSSALPSHLQATFGQLGGLLLHCVWHQAVSTVAASLALQDIGSTPGLRAEFGLAAFLETARASALAVAASVASATTLAAAAMVAAAAASASTAASSGDSGDSSSVSSSSPLLNMGVSSSFSKVRMLLESAHSHKLLGQLGGVVLQ